jgi:hypothetical protein
MISRDILLISVTIGIVGIASLIPLIGLGIYFLSKQSKEGDKLKKESMRNKGIIYIFLPWALIISSILLFFIAKMLGGSLE